MPESVHDEVSAWLGRRARSDVPNAALAERTVVDGWRVAAFLGRGRTAEVYRVVDTVTGHEGALKLLTDFAPDIRARFERECNFLRFVRDPGMPAFYGRGTRGDAPYFVMEYLRPLILPLPPPEAVRLMRQLARTVATLHAAGFVHRDIKPGNVLLRSDGRPVLVDFGLTKRTDEGVTLVGGRPQGAGTLDFAAPEQLLKGESSVAGDVYSLGKTLAAMCGGTLPRALARVVRRATSAAPVDRYPSAAAFAAALDGVRWRRWLACGAAAVLVLAAIGFACAGRRPRPATSVDASEVRREPVVATSPPKRQPSLVRQPQESEAEHFERVRKLAEDGLVEAQVRVAEAYFHGYAVTTNYVEAVRWYRRAAEQGDAGAQASLGLCALRGWGRRRDPESAVNWLMLAADQENLGAMADLAFCYLNGIGVSRDESEGFRWAMRAASCGHPTAQTLVGECYLDGRGTSADPVRADVWLQRAARQGNARARLLLETR